tara:strand:- start:199 stop:345 length:147 start_codon:yes stop_codon:yes gene_type:complete
VKVLLAALTIQNNAEQKDIFKKLLASGDAATMEAFLLVPDLLRVKLKH